MLERLVVKEIVAYYGGLLDTGLRFGFRDKGLDKDSFKLYSLVEVQFGRLLKFWCLLAFGVGLSVLNHLFFLSVIFWLRTAEGWIAARLANVALVVLWGHPEFLDLD